jgi:hypothetical protein
MMSHSQLVEIQSRIDSGATSEELRGDAQALLSEVMRLTGFVKEFSSQVTGKLETLEEDMVRMENENARLRSVCESTYFERDACVGLIARLARLNGMPAGTGKFKSQQENSDGSQSLHDQHRVVVDLPTGQVSWEYLEAEAHLFESLPEYAGELKDQSVRDIYSKVMEPGLAVEPF